MNQTIRRTLLRSIVTSTLALTLVGSAALMADAASQASGWSSFETGTWQPQFPLPSKQQQKPKNNVVVKAATSYQGWIAEGKSHQTPYYVYDSGVQGPTVVVTGGMHGDEPAGWKSAWSVKDYWVKKGRIVVIPELNRPAVRKGTRTSSLGDLNRDFPRTKSDSPDNYLAKSIWSIMVKYHPDWLIDMHEGYSFHLVNKKSVGQTVIYYPKADAKPIAQAMAAAANQHVDKDSHAFTVLKNPVSGSLARAVSIRLGTKGMIVETSDKQAMATRTAQHLAAVDAMLTKLGMR